MGYIDLHVHSTYSDGTYTPEELILLAKKANLVAISLTDHDTISGIESAILAGEKYQIQVIPGIELSAKYKDKDIHILGYQIDYKSSSLHKKLMEYEAVRERRNEKIIDCLNKIGFSITVEDIRKRFPIGTITRLHIAKYLVECGYVKSLQEVFQKYLGDNGCCYVAKQGISLEDAIGCILEYGGYPVLAHPMRYKLEKKQLEDLIVKCKSYGLVGIETMYSMNTAYEEEQTRQLANKYQLFITGGSDFHGQNKPQIHLGIGKGNLKVPSTLLSYLGISKKDIKK